MIARLLLATSRTGIFFALLAGACATKPQPTSMSEGTRAAQLASFDETYTKIKDRHFDPEKVGPQWDAKHAELRPKVENARTADEARSATKELIASLGQSHFGIIAADAYEDIAEKPGDESQSQTDGGAEPGFELRAINGQAVVTRIVPDSPASKAGVQRGWALTAVNGKPVAPILSKLKKAHADSRDSGLMMAIALRGLLHGPDGAEARYEFLGADDRPISVRLNLEPPQGTPVRFGNLPTMYIEVDRRPPAPGIGYMWFSAWFDPPKLITELQAAIKDCKSCEGFVLDLRGNVGGIGALAMGFGGWFVDKPDQKLGTLITRDTRLNFVLNPRSAPFTGPLAILVDEMSASTSEIFAGGMQDIGRARVFGSPTPGAALPSTVEVLPSGDRLQFAFANYISAKGEPLEARGVHIDEPVAVTRDALLAGRDPVLDAAVAWIRSPKK
ncbi:MAG: hypothetical protein JNM86_06005 [Phycisphaerae bacterium]|nr:hypothetical protein [Phycisphaerae bacterium]